MKTINRRDTLKLIALSPVAAGAGALAGCTTPDEEHDHAPAAVEEVVRRFRDGTAHVPPMFFNEHEYATLQRLVDFILPADDASGSATDAGVPAFIDFMALDVDEPEPFQVRLRGGLAWLDHQCALHFDKTFLACDAAACRDVLDRIAFPDVAEPGMEAGVAFFNLVRDLTASGFYTTRMGFDDLQYVGNTFVAEWTGAPQEVLDHAGVTYDDWPDLSGV